MLLKRKEDQGRKRRRQRRQPQVVSPPEICLSGVSPVPLLPSAPLSPRLLIIIFRRQQYQQVLEDWRLTQKLRE